MTRPSRVLFVLRTKLGDTLIHFQTARAFAARHPGSEVWLLTRRDYAPLLGNERGVRFVFFRNRAELLVKLAWLRVARPAFDALAVLTGYGPAMLQIARLVRARRRLFFDGRFAAAYDEFPPDYPETSLVDRSWQTLRLLDPGLPRPDRLVLDALRDARAASRNRAGAVGIVPLANELRRNLDGATLARLVERVRSTHPQRPVWILVNPGDRGAAELERAQPGAGVEWRRFRTLADLVPLYRELDAWYGTDTGLYHLAVAMGIPATVFFGPTQPQLIVMPAQPEATWIRLAALGDRHCEVKDCARPGCLHHAIARWGGGVEPLDLAPLPAACPMRAATADSLERLLAHEAPRHQA